MTNTPLKRIVFIFMVCITGVTLFLYPEHPISHDSSYCYLCTFGKISLLICLSYWVFFIYKKFFPSLSYWIKTGELKRNPQETVPLIRNSSIGKFLYYFSRLILVVATYLIFGCIFDFLCVSILGVFSFTICGFIPYLLSYWVWNKSAKICSRFLKLN